MISADGVFDIWKDPLIPCNHHFPFLKALNIGNQRLCINQRIFETSLVYSAGDVNR